MQECCYIGIEFLCCISTLNSSQERSSDPCFSFHLAKLFWCITLLNLLNSQVQLHLKTVENSHIDKNACSVLLFFEGVRNLIYLTAVRSPLQFILYFSAEAPQGCFVFFFLVSCPLHNYFELLNCYQLGTTSYWFQAQLTLFYSVGWNSLPSSQEKATGQGSTSEGFSTVLMKRVSQAGR